ncbi:MAG: hypothetical protein B7X41_05735 [Microbacterium sp. 14-71-5]|jgi:replicative DNA helicase|nr:MAG: hypothetical protein B7X41_05735 [Microbacterium sp. 14-71-5]
MTDAERYVLGAVMLSRAALDEVSEILSPADMAVPAHETIYAAIRKLHDEDAPTGVIAVTDELIRTGNLVGSLDPAYLHALTDGVSTASNAEYHARIVKAASVRRKVRAATERASAVAADDTISVDEVLELARAAFDDVDADTAHGVEAIGEWLTDHLASLAEKPSYTPTPWLDLNHLVYGFRDGGLYVIAARPGDGKTIMGVQVALDQAKRRPVLFVSLEMKREEIASRAISALGQIFIGSLNRHQLTDTEWRNVAAQREDLSRLPLVVVDSSEVETIPQLKAKVRAVKRRFKRNPVVVIDYLQLLTSRERVESRQVEVAGFSRALKQAAIQWNVPVVALSQLNRAGAHRRGRSAEPQLSDLRESGAIEQDADVVMLLHRKPSAGQADELKVIVAKNRQGQQGDVSLIWQGQFSRVLSKYQANEQINFNDKGNS